MVAASFSAWQIIGIQVEKLPTWDKYIKKLGLLDEPKLSKEDLKREAQQAMDNANKIIEKARRGYGSR